MHTIPHQNSLANTYSNPLSLTACGPSPLSLTKNGSDGFVFCALNRSPFQPTRKWREEATTTRSSQEDESSVELEEEGKISLGCG